jgi:haloalkane dehalogenase
MEVLRTPDEQFAGLLLGYPRALRYTEVDGLRIHHVGDRPAGAGLVLLLHGEPT